MNEIKDIKKMRAIQRLRGEYLCLRCSLKSISRCLRSVTPVKVSLRLNSERSIQKSRTTSNENSYPRCSPSEALEMIGRLDLRTKGKRIMTCTSLENIPFIVWDCKATVNRYRTSLDKQKAFFSSTGYHFIEIEPCWDNRFSERK